MSRSSGGERRPPESPDTHDRADTHIRADTHDRADTAGGLRAGTVIRRHNERMSVQKPVSENPALLPVVGHFVELHEAGGRSSLGRVQEASVSRIVVSLPSDASIVATGRVGAGLEIMWSGDGGVEVLSATLIDRHPSPQLELWEFVPAGEAQFEQRRHDPRVPSSGPVTVAVLADPGADGGAGADGAGMGAALTGNLVDLSATALRCVVEVHAEDAVVASGTRVRCEFSLAGAAVSLRGVVHTAWTEGASSSVRIVAQFDQGQPDLAVVARYVADARARG